MSLALPGAAVSVFLLTLLLTALSGLFMSRFGGSSHGSGMEQWGLGGRQFGTLVTWFLVGGDFYTAYTVLAVPALVYGTGAAGFFALPYTILVYPFVYAVMPRLWSVSRRHGLVTSADFVKLRYGSGWLATAIALTGVVALEPYIALQFAGIRTVLKALGVGSATGAAAQLPLLLAFLAVSIFTYVAGLRGPALIAFSKDTMIYIVVIAAVILLPASLGGYHSIFHAADMHFRQNAGGSVILRPEGFSGYVTLAMGSALAAFLYPHTLTSVLASANADVIRKNAILLPAYTFLLGLVALLGIAGVAAGLHLHSAEDVVPALFARAFSPWFFGFAMAAIVVAALVPASIMSIAAANLFTRNLFSRRDGAAGQVSVARRASIVVNAIALAMVVLLPTRYSVNLQLLGGALILQTLPAIVFGLWRGPWHAHALLSGWAVGLVTALLLLSRLHFAATLMPLQVGGHTVGVYIGLLALLTNLLTLLLTTFVLQLLGRPPAFDGTARAEYIA